MSNDKNIENFDSFFNEAFNGFEPKAPDGVFEAIQSQIGVAGGGAATGATTAAKAGAWGVGKVIVSAVATIAVATTVYIAIPSKTKTATNATEKNTIAQTEINPNQLTELPTEEKNTSSGDIGSNELAETNNPKANQQNEGVSYDVSNSNNSIGNSNAIQSTHTDDAGNTHSQQKTKSPLDNNNGVEVDEPKGKKAIVGIYLSDKQLCANDRLTVTIADDLSKYKYEVDFGDGTSALTQIGKPTTHNYAKGGKYKIRAVETTGKKETVEQWVEVRSTKAEFEVENIDKATYRFINKSKNAAYYTWFFGDNSEISQEETPEHTYKNFTPKSYKAKLIAVDNVGCLDSFSTYIKQNYTFEDKKPKMYNVFSPGVDGKNDHFEIEISNYEKYHLIIFDKSGNKVFESRDKEKMWDGRNMYTGNNCPAANYVVMFTYKINGFEEQQEKKFVALVR